ncbi:MAG: hypothetical protein ACO3F6_07365, partial [Ilumatobacteraceae bacterium]
MNSLINMPIQHPITLETLAVQNGEIRLDLANEAKELRSELAAEFKDVRADISTLRTEMHVEIG